MKNPVLYFNNIFIKQDEEYCRQIYNELWNTIEESNLIKNIEKVIVGIVIDDENIDLDFFKRDKSEIIIFTESKWKNWPYDRLSLLDEIKNYCDLLDENQIIGYINNYGFDKGSEGLDFIRRRECYTYHIIQNYALCFEELKEVDAVGVYYHGEFGNFEGNFWWAQSEFIKKLPQWGSYPKKYKKIDLENDFSPEEFLAPIDISNVTSLTQKDPGTWPWENKHIINPRRFTKRNE
jgi:hypothetical protein